MKWIVDAESIDDLVLGNYSVQDMPLTECKDCKHRDAETFFCEGRGWPMQLVPDDGFCSKGERREE